MMSRSAIRGTALVCVVVLAAGACSYQRRNVSVPIPDEAQSSRVYSADGTLITTLHAEENRENVRFEEIPAHVREAVVAIEDERFYRHNGIDVRAVLRAVEHNTSSGRVEEGGSTITQQYVKTALLSDSSRTLNRKLEEASLALQLERTYTKDKILELYLNTVYFGNGAYGVQAAAHQYFDKSIHDVTVAEGALLAGLIQAPSRHDPFDHPDDALARRRTVLTRMVSNDYITKAVADAAHATPLGVTSPVVPTGERYPGAYFVEEVKQWVLDDARFGATARQRRELLFGGGLRIQTTIDLEMQRKAEDAMNEILPDAAGPSVSLVAAEPATGFVRAMVGGRDFFSERDKFNLATQARRQAGSSFKPLVLASALERGVPLTSQYAAPGELTIDRGKYAPAWHVSNYGEGSAGIVSLEEATVHSYNTVYAQLIMQVGAQPAMDTASRLGVRSPLEPYPSSVLGSNGVTALDMTSAYATIANRGVHNPPVLVTRITRPDGTVLYSHDPAPTQVLAERVADEVTRVLREVIDRGTGTRAKLNRPVAGKTGTAQGWKDAWFAGFTPDLSAAVWVGFRDSEMSMTPPRTPIKVVGGTYPARIWQRFMSRALVDTPATKFGYQRDADAAAAAAATTTSTAAGTSTTSTTMKPRPIPRSIIPPKVVGTYAEDAAAALLRAGFTVSRVAVIDPSVKAGRVAGQWPPSGVRTTTGSTVTILVNDSAGDRRLVPHLIGMRTDDAAARLRRAGFVVNVVNRYEPATATARLWAGRVWRQLPTSGSVVSAEQPVTIWADP
jgi:penicillin-binding protein 1A